MALATISTVSTPSTLKRARVANTAALAITDGDLLGDYVEQTQLRASYALADVLNPPLLTIGLHRSLVGGSLRRATYSVEGALRYALKHSRRQPIAVIAADSSDGNITADIVVADRHRLMAHLERSFGQTDSASHSDLVHSTITEIRHTYPLARVVQAGDSDLQIDGVTYVGQLASPARPVLQVNRSVRQQLKMPALIALAGLAIYVVALALGWSQYAASQRAYRQAVADPIIAKAGGIDNAALDVLQQRRLYMDEPRRQVLLARKAAEIVTGISSVAGVHIVSMSLPAPSISATQQFGVATAPAAAGVSAMPDVQLTVAVQRAGDNAMDQAQVVMQQLVTATGLSLRLVYAGWRDVGDTREFTLEGFVSHDAK